MPGFDTGSVLYALNVDFTGNSLVAGTAQVTSNGQLLIGSSVAPNIRVGTLGSSDSSITWTVGNGTITGQVAGGTTVGKTITGNIGGAISPTAGNWNILASAAPPATTPIQTSGSGSTISVNVQRSQAVASTDASRVGLAAFNSGDFSVDANGFVSIISGGFAWNNVSGASATMAKENGYQANNAGLVTLTMPSVASSTFGDTIKIAGFGSGGWLVQCVAAQLIHFGSSATSAAGSLASTNRYDALEIVCSSTTTEWFVRSSVGNLTVV